METKILIAQESEMTRNIIVGLLKRKDLKNVKLMEDNILLKDFDIYIISDTFKVKDNLLIDLLDEELSKTIILATNLSEVNIDRITKGNGSIINQPMHPGIFTQKLDSILEDISTFDGGLGSDRQVFELEQELVELDTSTEDSFNEKLNEEVFEIKAKSVREEFIGIPPPIEELFEESVLATNPVDVDEVIIDKKESFYESEEESESESDDSDYPEEIIFQTESDLKREKEQKEREEDPFMVSIRPPRFKQNKTSIVREDKKLKEPIVHYEFVEPETKTEAKVSVVDKLFGAIKRLGGM